MKITLILLLALLLPTSWSALPEDSSIRNTNTGVVYEEGIATTVDVSRSAVPSRAPAAPGDGMAGTIAGFRPRLACASRWRNWVR